MIASQITSISELRTNWKKILDSLHDSHKYILVNNKPKAVLLSCEEYEALKRGDDDWTAMSEKNKTAYHQAKKELHEGQTLSLDQLKQKYATL